MGKTCGQGFGPLHGLLVSKPTAAPLLFPDSANPQKGDFKSEDHLVPVTKKRMASVVVSGRTFKLKKYSLQVAQKPGFMCKQLMAYFSVTLVVP
jgi:hypothetical protein